VVTFGYDARGRLLSEQRTDAGPWPVEYSLAYAYDALGNRLVKTDYQAGRTTFYHYDVHETPDDFASHNNRLQWYRVYNGIFVAEPDPAVVTPLEEVMYIYDAGGHPVVIARRTDGDPVHDGLRLVYSAGGQLWLVMSYEWQCDGEGAVVPESVECTAVREFRYETGRARYLVQDRDPVTLDVIPGTEHWSEYDSDTIYADYDIVSEAPEVTRMYLPGIAQMDSGAINPEYFHSDQVGTTRAMTDSSYPAQVVRRASYTAFGEVVDSSGSITTRYGYVGAHGYEETLLPGWGFLHVGARWYDPSTGRFLQRDPIGIRGGLNVYEYVYDLPTNMVDPLGHAAHTSDPDQVSESSRYVRDWIIDRVLWYLRLPYHFCVVWVEVQEATQEGWSISRRKGYENYNVREPPTIGAPPGQTPFCATGTLTVEEVQQRLRAAHKLRSMAHIGGGESWQEFGP